jgi:hypothetical protein
MSKVWYRSATLWALAVSALAHCLVLLGVNESEAETAAAELVRALAPVVGLVADAVGAWGRRRAEGPLTISTDDRRLE